MTATGPPQIWPKNTFQVLCKKKCSLNFKFYFNYLFVYIKPTYHKNIQIYNQANKQIWGLEDCPSFIFKETNLHNSYLMRKKNGTSILFFQSYYD